MRDVPCIVLALALAPGLDHVIPAVQNLMLARSGSVRCQRRGTRASCKRFHAMFAIPDDVAFHFCVPLGYPQGNFGPNVRKPTSETTYLNRWAAPVPWD